MFTLNADENYVATILSEATTYCCELAYRDNLYFVRFPYTEGNEELQEAFEESAKIFRNCGIDVKPFPHMETSKILFILKPKELQTFVLMHKMQGV